MPSDASISPAVYTGPLKIHIGEGVSQKDARDLVGAARTMLGKAIAAADAVGLRSTSMWHTFDNGVTVRVARLGSLHIAEFVAHPTFALSTPQGGKGYDLTIYGGVTVNNIIYLAGDPYATDEGRVDVDLMDRFTPGESTLRKLAARRRALEKQLDATTDEETRKRLWQEIGFLHDKGDTTTKKVPYLAVRIAEQFKPMYERPSDGMYERPDSQYRLFQPTRYSGRMRIVMQLVLGLGKQHGPDREEQEAYRPEAEGPYEDYAHESAGAPPDDYYLASVEYDFCWDRTHGVYKSPQGRYYLIEISKRGVYAMRLPVLPDSSWILPESAAEYLSDLPLGYGFPRRERVGKEKKSPWDSAVEDGWVKELIPEDGMEEFYGQLQYSYHGCGWAFSMSGSKANNVGWKAAGPRPYDYPVFEHWMIEFSGGDGAKGSKNVYDYSHVTGGFDDSLATLNANMRFVERGNAINMTPTVQPFKIPAMPNDPKPGTVPNVISFDFVPVGMRDVKGIPADYAKVMKNYPKSDAVIHVFYDDEELVWIRYSNSSRDRKKEEEAWDDRNEIDNTMWRMGWKSSPREVWTLEDGWNVLYAMTLGQYTWGARRWWTRPKEGFYSNAIDPREEDDEDNISMRSKGRKAWESLYFRTKWTWPYPPPGYGYQDTMGNSTLLDGFDPECRSVKGSPWTMKRHCFHVHVQGTATYGKEFTYACAVSPTDREAAFIFKDEHIARKDTINRMYTVMVGQLVYYTASKLFRSMESLSLGFGLFGKGLQEWEKRDDTVKMTRFKFWDEEHNYTKEKEEKPQTILNISDGVEVAPVEDWDRSVYQENVHKYKIYTIQSSLGGEYPKEMQAVPPNGGYLWTIRLPAPPPGPQRAVLWCTKSVLGKEGYKQSLYLDGEMHYAGVREKDLTGSERKAQSLMVTFIGET